MESPGFTAEASLGRSSRSYHGRYRFGGRRSGRDGMPAEVLASQSPATEQEAYEEDGEWPDATDACGEVEEAPDGGEDVGPDSFVT